MEELQQTQPPAVPSRDAAFARALQVVSEDLSAVDGPFYVELPHEVFCRIVEESGTDIEGYVKAAADLKGKSLDAPVAVGKKQFKPLVDSLLKK